MGQLGYLFNLIFTYPIFNALMLLYHVFGDFALSIIVLTVVIKLILFPLTLQQLKSMKATQALQPQMAEIRKKYAKDQQGQALAMQALYKEYGINPVAGCLPLLIQLPVLYGLYFALNEVLRNAHLSLESLNAQIYPFLPHFTTLPNVNLNWFTFINPSFHISLGSADPTHILPILAAVATFIQLRMSQPKTASAAPANDPASQSMKTMQYIMPVFTGFIAWTFPAGLALYWTTSTIFQMVQQYFVTGWGSLLTTPKFLLSSSTPTASGSKSNGTVSSNSSRSSSQRREIAQQKQVEANTDKGGEEGNENQNAVESRMRTRTTTNGSTPASRRPSASARRRSSNNQKKRVSRK